MTINRQWRLKTRPSGLIGPEHFEYVETELVDTAAEEVLVRNLCLSFDPTQRGWVNDMESYMPPVAIGEVMRAGTVGQVVESNHADFEPGDLVQGLGGGRISLLCLRESDYRSCRGYHPRAGAWSVWHHRTDRLFWPVRFERA